jgi:predicted outer membrane repeat protein
VPLVLAASVALATTWVVAKDGAGDFGSLAEAIAVADTGDTIEVGPGSFKGGLEVRRNIAIHGDPSGETEIDGAGDTYALIILAARLELSSVRIVNAGAGGIYGRERAELVGTELVLEGLGSASGDGAIHFEDGAISLTGGRAAGNRAVAGAAVRMDYGRLGLDGLTLEGNEAGNGGAIFVGTNSELTLSATSLIDNVADGRGGAISAGQGTTVVAGGATFRGNRADEGGSLAVSGSLTLSSSTLEEGTAANGGHLWLDDGAASAWLDNDVTGGVATRGGVAWLGEGASFDDLGSRFSGASASEDGGGLYVVNGTVSLADDTWTGLSAAGRGGAIRAVAGTLTVDTARFDANIDHLAGGAVSTGEDSSFVATDTSFVGNGSRDGGGALGLEGAASLVGVLFADNLPGGAVASTGDMVIDTCRFSGNAAAREGGALRWQGGALTVDGSVFEQNVGTDGGAIFAADGTVSVLRSAFSGNTALRGGGLFLASVNGASTLSTLLSVDDSAEAGGAVALLDAHGPALVNLTVARADGESAIWLASGAATVENVIVAEPGGAAFGADEGALEVMWALVQGAATVTDGEVTTADLAEGDPRFVVYEHQMAASELDLRLLRGSPAIDAGNPELLDADGSRSDLGAYGGPGFEADDADGDGWDEASDCDDTDGAVHPGLPEIWYDGVDQDCDGNDDDQDGDGVPYPEDCDDTDPTRTDDCSASGKADPLEAAGECGCAPGGVLPGWPVAVTGALAALACRRRRRSPLPGRGIDPQAP